MSEIEDRLREHFRRQVERQDPNPTGRVHEVHERAKGQARRRTGIVAAAVVIVGCAGAAVAGGLGSPDDSGVDAATDQSGRPDSTSDSAGTGTSEGTESGDAALWLLPDGASLGSETTQFTARVFRLGCNGGKTGQVYAPAVTYEQSRVVVTFAVDRAQPGNANCLGNAPKPYEVRLDQPLGDRTLVDGACLPGEPGEDSEDCLPDGVRQDSPPAQSLSSSGGPGTAVNAEATKRALAALAAAGVDGVVTTPGYGAEVNTAVEGSWRGSPVRASVVPTELTEHGELRRVGIRVINGQQVEIVQGEDSSVQYYRFELGADTWLLASLDPGESQTDPGRTGALTAALLGT